MQKCGKSERLEQPLVGNEKPTRRRVFGGANERGIGGKGRI